ncbi:TTAGGG repeat binding factor [Coemansia sp. RSA 1821]|nr:TTAGGG repeat binding factor [Coemansia sp. RSA 1821]
MARQNTNLSLSTSRQNSALDGDSNRNTLNESSMQQQEDLIEKRRTTWNVPVLKSMMKGASALFQSKNSQDDVTRRHSLNTSAHSALSADDGDKANGEKSQTTSSASSSASSIANGKRARSLASKQVAIESAKESGARDENEANIQGSAAAANGSGLEEEQEDIEVSSSGILDDNLKDNSSSEGEDGSSSSDASGSSDEADSSDDSGDSEGESSNEESSDEESANGDSASDDSAISDKESSSKEGDGDMASNKRLVGLGRGNLSQIPPALGTQTHEEPLDTDSVPPAESAPDMAASGTDLLPAFSQDDLFSQALMRMPQDDQNRFVGPGTAADLLVLDYLSQRVLDEVDVLGRLLEDLGSAPSESASAEDVDQAFQRLDSLAREHTLMRCNHFTSEQFLSNAQRPADDTDVVHWAVALHRINLATFALLIFRPQLTVTETVSKNMPNREWLLASLGFEEASSGFFAHIVPANRRDNDAIGLLVDMQTQQWLMAAVNESHLQSMVANARRAGDAAIYKLLGIDAEENSQAGKAAIATYRMEIGRRLNKISGGKLTITRAQYTLHDVWKRAAQFCHTCVQAMSPPLLLSGCFKGPDAGEVSDVISEADVEQEISKSQSSIEGDFEVTVYTSRVPKHKQAPSPSSPRTCGPPAEPAVEETQEHDVQAAPETDAGPIDPSFSEERRLAVVLRDALDDAHLDELMEHISAEHIDIEQDQASSHTPRRMRVLRSRRITVSPPSQQQQQQQREISYADDDLDLHFDDGRLPSVDEAAQTASKADLGTGSKHELPLTEVDRAVAGAASMMIRAARKPAGRKRTSYAGQQSPSAFRGRRGIPAESLADLRADADANRIAFTPSAPGTPEPAGDAKAAPDQDADLAALGQYKPLRLEPREKRARRASSESDTESESEQQRRSTRRKRRNRKWSKEEEECLIRAVFEHGLRWSLIEEYHGTRGTVDQTLRGRTRFNIKDKARTIKLRLMREGKPLGPFAKATGHL